MNGWLSNVLPIRVKSFQRLWYIYNRLIYINDDNTVSALLELKIIVYLLRRPL